MNSTTSSLTLSSSDALNLTDSNSTDYVSIGSDGIALVDYILLPFKVMLSFVTALFNLIIVIVIVFMIKRRTYSNMIFLSMATADFIVGIISLPFMTIYSTYKYWPLGYTLCIAWCINDWTSGTVTLFSMLLISAHRYFQIKDPLKTTEKLTKLRCITLIGLWPLAFCCWLTSILSVTLTNDFDPEGCYFTYTFAFVLSSDMVVFIIPILLIVGFNLLTYLALKARPKSIHLAVEPKAPSSIPPERNSRRLTAVSIVKKTSAIQDSQINSIGLKSNIATITAQQNRLKNDRNAFNCLICILINLIVNWCIFITAWPITAICPDCVNGSAYEVGYWTTYIYSAINAVILYVFNENFRVGTKNLFKKILPRFDADTTQKPESVRAPSARVGSIPPSVILK